VKRLQLHHWILIAMAVGAALGLGLNWAGVEGVVDSGTVATVAMVGKEVGDLFLRLLQMLVVPLIVSSLVTGVTGMGDLRTLGSIGGRAIVFYLTTSFLAILTGIFVVNLIKPGEGAQLALLEEGATDGLVAQAPGGIGTVLWQQLESLIPKNPLAAATEGDMLPVIFFSLLIGVFIGIAEHREGSADASVVRRFFSGLFDVMMEMTLFVVKFAPLGVFGARGLPGSRLVRAGRVRGPANPRDDDLADDLEVRDRPVSRCVHAQHDHRARYRVQHGLEQRYPAPHDAKRRGCRRETAGRLVRLAARRDDQHGWHCTLRSGSRSVHRAGVRD
jgi:hypothetical protein